MSSFWKNIRGRKNSNYTENCEGTKPPSGRSSSSRRISDSLDEEMKRQDKDEKSGHGCLKGVCTSAEQFPCHSKSLNNKLIKIQKIGLVGRKISRGNDVPPTPVPTPEPETIAFPEFTLKKPPIPDSPKPKIKSFRKRAASASPSRFHGENRKIFRGLSKERFIAPFPNSIKNLFLHKSQSKPNVSLAEKCPLKPMRKPGPLGRSWIKVFSDITYVDDISEDNYPVIGNSGYPTKIPDAQALPKPPTPPPQKVRIYDIRVENIKLLNAPLNGENIQYICGKENCLETPREDTDKQINTKVEKRPNESSESLSNEFKVVASKTENEVKDEKLDKQNNADKISLFKIERPSRNKGAIRHKTKRSKRSGTPIGDNIFLRSPDEVASDQSIASSISDTTSTDVIEDGYIFPQSKEPSKPPRGNKIYEKIAAATDNSHRTETINVSDDIFNSQPIIKSFTVDQNIPDRPKRGNKIYDNTSHKINNDDTYNKIHYPENICEKQFLELDIKTAEWNNCTDNKLKEMMEELPAKPKRKPKLYENINFSSNEQTPSKQFRRYEECNKTFTKDKLTSNDKICNENLTISSEIALSNNINTDNDGNKENIDLEKNGNIKNAYAIVYKDRLSKELKYMSLNNEKVEYAPPIPPKNKNIKSLDNDFSQQSLKPPLRPRTVLSKTRSAETSPSRPRRKIFLAQINRESSPQKPTRYTRVYTELQIVKSKTNKAVNSNLTATGKNKTHSREFRQNCPLPPPPRPKKSPAVQRNKKTQCNDKELNPILISERNEFHKGKVNCPLIKSTFKRRDRPPPPPPPNVKGKMHDVHIMEQYKNNILFHQDSDYNISTNSLPLENNNLDVEIENNIKNIQHSFHTLESVLHSLKSYVTLPPAWSHERTNRRLSCDVVCDRNEDISYSINQHNRINNDVFNVDPIHNSGFDSHNTDLFTNLSNKNVQEVLQTCILENEHTLEKTECRKDDAILSPKVEVSNIVACPKVEFQVSIPSIISVGDKNIPVSDNINKLSCLLNIEPMTSKLAMEKTIINNRPIQDIYDTSLSEQNVDSSNEILEHYEGEIKAISKDLNLLKNTLERCESEYSEEVPQTNEQFVVGKLLFGDKKHNNKSSELNNSDKISDINVSNKNLVQMTSPEDIIPCDFSISINTEICEINSVNEERSNEKYNCKNELFRIENPASTYSFSENLNRTMVPSKSRGIIDTNFPEAALAMERMLESVSTSKISSKGKAIFVELEEKNSGDSEIHEKSLVSGLVYPTTNELPSKEFDENILNIGDEIEDSICHITNKDSEKEMIDDDSSEDVSDASSCTVEELMVRIGTPSTNIPVELNVSQNIQNEINSQIDISSIKTDSDQILTNLDSKETHQIVAKEEHTKENFLSPEIYPNTLSERHQNKSPEMNPSTCQLLHGVADITGQLEGIRSQLEAVMSSYIPPIGLSDSSLDYTSSESPSSSISNRSSFTFEQSLPTRSLSNRSSVNFDRADSSHTSFYSLSQPSLSNSSLLSFYSARSPSPSLSEFPINTSVESLKGDMAESNADDST